MKGGTLKDSLDHSGPDDDSVSLGGSFCERPFTSVSNSPTFVHSITFMKPLLSKKS